jgi:hypothetical protein
MPVETQQDAPSVLYQENEFKFGFHPDAVTAAIPADIWDNAVAVQLYPWPAAPVATTVRSDAAGDTALGTGMQEVTVVGIAVANGPEVTQAVDLNGVTPVALPTDLFRVNRMFGSRFGATDLNAGNILCEQAGPVVISRINIARGQTLQAIYTVPLRTEFTRQYLTGYSFGISRQNIAIDATVLLQTREPGANQGWRVRTIEGLNSQGSSYVHRSIGEPGLQLAVGTDIRCTLTDLSQNNTGVSADFDIRSSP